MDLRNCSKEEFKKNAQGKINSTELYLAATDHSSFNTHSVARPGAHSTTLGEGFSAGECVSENKYRSK